MVCSRAVRVPGGIHHRVGVTGAVVLVGLAGCGGPARQDANEPEGTFSVDVVSASFPTSQRLAQRSTMEIAVRNAGERTLPNVAVTVEPVQPGARAAAEAFQEASPQQGLADPSRPVWVLDAGPRGGVTAYTNTWALGPLRPSQVKTFRWRVTAVKPGMHTLRYTVAAGLDGKAKARLPGGERPTGSFTINISSSPSEGRLGGGDQPQ